MTKTNITRAWRMHGHANSHAPGEFLNIENHPRTAAMYGPDVVPLLVTEDPAGNYLGWLDNDNPDLAMVQWHTLFNMQFAYGAQAEVDAGRGTIIRLSVTELDPNAEIVLPSSWDMYAHQSPTGHYSHVNTRASRTALYSTKDDVLPVTVTPDPNGQYTGWIDTGTTTPTHIARTHLFDMAFIYGHQVEQERGKGYAITLNITPREPQEAP